MTLILIMRGLQGIGDSCVAISGFAIVTLYFAERKRQYLGYCMTARGVGVSLGPIIGGLIYGPLKFNGTFYFFAGTNIISFLLVMFMVPNSVNAGGPGMDEEVEKKDDSEDKYQISYCRILMNFRALMAIITASVTLYLVFFFDATLVTHLQIDVGLDVSLASQYYAVCVLVFSLTSPVVGYIH
jgi:MFS family permease